MLPNVIAFISVFLIIVVQGNNSALYAASNDQVEKEIQLLLQKLPELNVFELNTKPGNYQVSPDSCLTVNKLRGITLDESPPRLRRNPSYGPNSDDGYRKKPAPYIAKGVSPFLLNQFDCELVYGGQHNARMRDYAATHGFQTIYPWENLHKVLPNHFPPETKFMRWASFSWPRVMKKNGVPKGRYDLLNRLDVEAAFARTKKVPNTLGFQKIMIDLEHDPHSPAVLRKQSWYPKSASGQPNLRIENSYYDGFRKSLIEPISYAKKKGWEEVTVYGWSPYGRDWYGIKNQDSTSSSWKDDWQWKKFGRSVYDALDTVSCSVYCRFWTSKNVAYVLANIDENIRRINQTGNPKPLKPYFHPLVTGGGGEFCSYRQVPLPNEEQQAMITAAFFTGVEGVVVWNASRNSNHHIANYKDIVGSDRTTSLMVRETFKLKSKMDASGFEIFPRYTALYVVRHNQNSDVIEFQKVGLNFKERKKEKDKLKGKEVFSAKFKTLKNYLRPRSEPMSAIIEGLALTKPIENILKTGEVKIDVPAKRQFLGALPIVRRVKKGNLHLIFTYDPGVIYGNEPRKVVLSDFDRNSGLNLELAADEQSRIYIVRVIE